MKVALQERGLITPAEWADAMGAAIRAAQACGDPDTGETYYRHWLVALEELLARNGLVDRVTRLRYQDAWERAAHRTPHGEAIELSPGDFAE